MVPPEPLPWDNNRRGGEFRRQQHDRSGSEPRGFGFGSSTHHRWRENYNHNRNYHHGPLTHAPPPSSYHHQQQQRWYSDFRNSRPLPHPYPGHGKQGGWHTHPDDAANGFVPFGSRYGERSLEDENCRPYGSRGGDGRYFRNNRDNRGSFVQKEWRMSSWEPATSPCGIGGPIPEDNSPRPAENTRALHDNCHKSSDASRSQPDAMNSSSQSQSVAAEQLDSNGGAIDGHDSSDQKLDKKDCLGSIDWKPLKWSRSGSLTSRGSGLSQSSCTKSVGVESMGTAAEEDVKIAAVPSPSADAAARATSAVAVPSDDNCSRKKPRLGWGEGLAKYEKKKVEDPEDGTACNALDVSIVRTETLQSPAISVPEVSPRVANLSDCASPATPSSVACSSSPGVMEKESIKKVSLEKSTSNFSCSPGIVSPTNYDEPAFSLENLNLTSIANLSSSIDELLRSGNQSAAEGGYVGTSSMNKLMVWKVDILKALEITESEIDSLETELKSFGSETRSDRLFATGSSSQLAECPLQACEESCSASHFAAKPISLQIVPSGATVMENAVVAVERELGLKNGEFDSPSSATSKFVEVLPAGDVRVLVKPTKCLEDCVKSDCKSSSYSDKICLNNIFNDGEKTGGDNHALHVINSCEELETVSNVHFDAEDVYDAIITSNKELARKAWEELSGLLPANQGSALTAFKLSCSPRSSSVAKDKYLIRKRFLRFKEKVLAIKYKVFQHFYKQGRVVSVRKLQLKSHKKYDLSHNGLKRKRSSSRFRILSPAGDQQTVPTSEVIEYVQSLLLQSRVTPCRNTLKMPALILDKEMKKSGFVSTNGLLEDPCAVENERSIINPWTVEEREIFMDKLSTFGKDFKTIASFLDHKTTADCIEFYYKNHKSEFFEKARKKPESMKQRKSQSNTYLITYGNKWNRESNAASLDILGAASAMAATGDNGLESQRKYMSRFVLPTANSSKALRNDGLFRRSHSPDFNSFERETVAADVLAGICGSFSSEAVSSCSVDRGNSSLEWMRSHRVRASMRHSLTPEIKLNLDDDHSDESSEDVGSIDWTDEEKSLFIHALSSYGKDFTAISQWVRTRSKDQCNLFYSKARKRLGLDLIRPRAQNCVDVNETGGADSGDACAVETGSIICNNGSESMVVESGHLPPCDVKSSHVSSTVGTSNVMPDSNMCEEASEPGPINSVGALPVFHDKLNGSSHVQDRAFLESKVDSKEQIVENEVDTSLPNGLCETAVNKRVENTEANSDGASGSSSVVSELKPGPNLARNGSQSSEELHSSRQNVSDLKTGKSMENSQCNLPKQNGHLEPMKASTLFSVPIKYQNILSSDSLAVIGANEIRRDSQKTIMENDSQQQIPCGSLSDYVDSSQILKGYPVSVQTVKDINGDANCKSAARLESAPKRNEDFRSDHHPEFFLKKCNGPSQKGTIGKGPFVTPELSRNCHVPTQSVSSSSEDKSSSNGDLKLFGKILVSSQHKPSSRQQETDGHSLNLNRNVSSDSSKLKLDSDSCRGSENVPLRNANFWDGNQMQQIGYPPLSDSARLLAKYPAAFSNYHLPTVKLGQSQLNGTITGSNNHLNGVSILSNKEIGNNGIGNYTPLINNGDLQNPFVIDMQQRNNGFDLVSGVRQQARANIGINGNFVGGQCPVVVSDPVAAIKMHFAKQMESNFKEDDNKWTSKGDLGR